MIAPACKHEDRLKHGKDRHGNQRYRCRTCGLTFTTDEERPLGDMRVEMADACRVLQLLLEDVSIRACERITGYKFAEVQGRRLGEMTFAPEASERFRSALHQLTAGAPVADHESYWLARGGERRLISWSTTVLPGPRHEAQYIIATGIDITERKRLEHAVLEVSNSEQRRIGQDLHDGLGQHLTGIAFMSKTLEQKLADKSLPEAADATKIVKLVNEAIHETRELARGLLPVQSDSLGLMSALQHWAGCKAIPPAAAREAEGAFVVHP